MITPGVYTPRFRREVGRISQLRGRRPVLGHGEFMRARFYYSCLSSIR